MALKRKLKKIPALTKVKSSPSQVISKQQVRVYSHSNLPSLDPANQALKIVY